MKENLLVNRRTTKFFIEKVLSRMEDDPSGEMAKILEYGNKLGTFGPHRFDDTIEIVKDKDQKWAQYAERVYHEIDRHILVQHLLNVGYEASFAKQGLRQEWREKLDANVPWTILFDPTSACNLHCTGCWAGKYGLKLNLSYEEMDSIVTQGKELGIYFYLMTGGEPLVRKDDILKLAEKHNDVAFHIFTNGTLIDEPFAEAVRKVGNISFALSLEGWDEENDARRGKGSAQRVREAMRLMKREGLLFGLSVCYTSMNYETVTSDAFLDSIIEDGARLIWYFHYMPVGADPALNLLLSPEQREYMIHRVREIRSVDGGKPIVAIDFQNDGEFIHGCIAGGKDYMHINANGDVEPCVFIHYSDANIREMSIKEALQQPLFQEYRKNQPFNKNHLRPCPMLENPGILTKMVEASGAHPTDLTDPMSADALCRRCHEYARLWSKPAQEIREELDREKAVH